MLLMLFFLSLTCVSASELNSTFDESDFESEYYNLKLNNKKTNALGNQYSLNSSSFKSIQEIINNASDNDAIILNGNFYAENYSSTIVIDKKLNIYSTDGAVLDARGLSGIFRLNEGSAGSVISGLTFINGKQGSGSAVYVLSKNNTFDNCVFQNNHGNENSGGAFATTYDAYATEGLTISNCLFKGNSAPVSSGAAAIFGTNFTVINTTFENNFASNNMWRAACEGALQVGMAGTKGIVYNCTFKNNYAKSGDRNNPSRGGAMGLREGTIVENCNFINNNADYGGAITYFTGGEVINCSFSRNSADYGGAISADSNVKFTNILNSNFTSNKADYGGALYLNSMEINIFQSVFTNNIVKKNGGAILSGKHNSVQFINISNSNFTNNKAENGGALYLNSLQTNILGSVFKNNFANAYGGAIYNFGILEIENCQFENNLAYSKLGVKLDSSKNYVNWSDDAVIKLTFNGGNNVINAIWSNQPVINNGLIIMPNNYIPFQKITFKVNGETYNVITDKFGVATFQLNTTPYSTGTYGCTASVSKSDEYPATSTNFNLHITDKIVHVSNVVVKQIGTEQKFHSLVPKVKYVQVEYKLFHRTKVFDVDQYIFGIKAHGNKTMKTYEYHWEGASKEKVDGKYKWYAARYYYFYTYEVKNTTNIFVNGKYNSTIEETYQFTNKSGYYTYRTSDFADYVLPSQDCQSDDDSIIKQANDIINAEAKRLNKKLNELKDEEKANAILNWVQKNIKYGHYGDTHRGALNTLKDRTGNCVDQTHLTVALLRAVNIPAKYESKKVKEREGHTWHWAYFNNKWNPGEATDSNSNYGESKWLSNNYLNKPPENNLHEVSHRFNSKYESASVKIYEFHLINNEWITYYGDVPSWITTQLLQQNLIKL